MSNNGYYPFELHCHTKHSDGQMTVKELVSAAKNRGLRGIALTDHNTGSGLAEAKKEGEKVGLTVISGIEWTTFFGHITLLGEDAFRINWREINFDNSEEIFRLASSPACVVSVAHPKRPGSPFCTGCYFEYPVEDYSSVSGIEVWSEYNPTLVPACEETLRWYDGLLNRGFKLSSLYGCDWHYEKEKMPLYAMTFLKGETEEEAVASIKNGRTYVSLGTIINVILNNESVDFGSHLCCGSYNIKLKAEPYNMEYYARYRLSVKGFSIVNNGERIDFSCLNGEAEGDIILKKGWCRFEIYGDIGRVRNKLICLTSPIYLE